MSTKQTQDSYSLDHSKQDVAVINGGVGSPYHIVKTATFDNRGTTPAWYEGHSASIGKATALCGHEPFGRMVPAEGNVDGESFVCGNCLRAFKSGDSE